MSKKILLTTLALLGCSVLGAGTVLAETNTPTATTSSSPSQLTDATTSLTQSLLAKLTELMSKGDELPATPANHQLLTKALADLDNYLKLPEVQLATSTDVRTLKELRQSLQQLIRLQYDIPKHFTLVLKQVPQLEQQRQDKTVDFDEFDQILETLLKEVEALDSLLPTVASVYDSPEDYQKDLAYLKDVRLYVKKLQEELYSGEDEVVDVPKAPVYWDKAKDVETVPTSESPQLTANSSLSPNSSNDQSVSSVSMTSASEVPSTNPSSTDVSSTPTGLSSTRTAVDSTSTRTELSDANFSLARSVTKRVLPKTSEHSSAKLAVVGVALILAALTVLKRRQN